MTTTEWLLVAMTCFAGAATPGPSLALAIQTSLDQGRLAGLAVGTGHGIGVFLYAALVAFGAGYVQAYLPAFFIVLQVIGAVFLAWLAWGMLGEGWAEKNGAPPPAGPDETRASNPALNGFLIVFFNPKIALFFLAIFSQFVTADQGIGVKAGMATLAGAIDAAWYCLIAFLVTMAAISGRLQQYSWQMNLIFGTILGLASLGIALRLALQ